MKKTLSFFLCALMIFSSLTFNAKEKVFAFNGEDAETLTKEWYGELDQLLVEENVDEAIISKEIKKLLRDYIEVRELSFNKPTAKPDFDIFADRESAKTLFKERNEDVDKYEEKTKISIINAEITLKISSAEKTEGEYSLTVDEWTFYDYFDLEGEMEFTDVSGYGTEHKMVLGYADDDLVILSDEYQEKTLKLEGLQNAVADEAEDESYLFNAEDFEADTNGEFISGYNIAAAVNYSNTYWSNYNPAYYNYTSLGGDCANFVSQCLHAGGMPMHYGAAYSSTCWFYTTSSNRSGSWTGAKESWYYWMTYRGYGIVSPNNSQVWAGCPVYVDWTNDGVIDHAYFCIGRNSSGTAIINSHTENQYHIKWNYGYSYSKYYTVQVTPSEGSSAPAQPTIDPKLEGYNPFDYGAEFHAYIKQAATNLYVTDSNYNVCVADPIFDKSQHWHFIRQSNGAYVIKNDVSGYVMDVYGNYSSDGTNIGMHQSNGGNNQQFFIYHIDGNFYFRTVPVRDR